ncbi:H-NS histone family protein [uncultured Thiocystis sp.]|uniref:H-NS histone family protein n=1 Tax=uncultured Thiocystis sp. TaxID=1202134 RepID=UPI0025EE5B77|nr:H-NS histone family protein [uncultured Thiocystis sp.]
MEYADLSVDEIRRQLEEAETKQAELNRILEVRRQEGKDDVIQQIRNIIEKNGYRFEEILPLVAPKRRRGMGAARKLVSDRQYTRYVDPDNADNIYVRGVLPGWMKQKMQEQGYDPGSKADRVAFKANSLQAIEG